MLDDVNQLRIYISISLVALMVLQEICFFVNNDIKYIYREKIRKFVSITIILGLLALLTTL